MKNILGTGILFFIALGCSAQADSSKGHVYIGFGGGMMLKHHTDPQPYAADVFPLARRTSFNLVLGFRYKLGNRSQLALEYMSQNYGISSKKFASAMHERNPDLYAYDDFRLDATNSTGKSFSSFSGLLKYNYSFSVKGFTLIPSLGLGIRKWRHRHYQYISRPANSNAYTTYTVHSHFKFHYVYYAGICMEHRKLKNIQLCISYTGSPLQFNYDIAYRHTDGTGGSDKVSFKTTTNALNFGLNFTFH